MVVEAPDDPEKSSAEAGENEAPSLAKPLTPREVEILRLLAQGQTNRGIAENMRVSWGIVKSYVRRVLAKLGASDRTQAAVRATQLGLLPPEE